MTAARRDRDRLADIAEAATKIADRVQHGRDRFDTDEDLQVVLTHLIGDHRRGRHPPVRRTCTGLGATCIA